MREVMRVNGKHRRRLLALTLVGTLAGALAACGGQGGGGGKDVFVFGTGSEPKTIYGPYSSDGETFRVVRQIYEGLVTNEPGTTKIIPALAEKWEADASGKVWTFHLRQGVKFHDGTDFNAQAVCFNFDRWYNYTGASQSPDVTYYWQTVFGGFKKNEDPKLGPSLYQSCQAKDPQTAVITLSKPSASFIPALSLPAFSIASPAALQKYGDQLTISNGSVQYTGKIGENPVGTGPYKFKEWKRGDRLVLERNDDYWGEKAKIKTLVFRAISDNQARLQELQSGGIDGYDLVAADDIPKLRDQYNLLEREALNVAYIGFNQKKKPLDDIRVRKAIAYALNREALVKSKYPPGAEVAKEFLAPAIAGWTADVPQYEYNPDKAKQLLAEAGQTNLTLEFWYPSSGGSRPYAPDPNANFQSFKADLEKVGIKVVAKGVPWTPDFLEAVDSGKAQMYMIGWNADFADADNFLGVFFQSEQPRFGFNNPQIFNLLNQAEQETDPAKRAELYQQANKVIMDFLPGVPYAHTKSYLVIRKEFTGLKADPLSNEVFAKVSPA